MHKCYARTLYTLPVYFTEYYMKRLALSGIFNRTDFMRNSVIRTFNTNKIHLQYCIVGNIFIRGIYNSSLLPFGLSGLRLAHLRVVFHSDNRH